MKIMVGVLVATLALWAGVMAISTWAEDPYEACIAAKIKKCERKAAMSASRSEWIRRNADRNRLKAEYLRNHREQLLEQMRAGQIEPKIYKIEYFLNASFTRHAEQESLTNPSK